MKSNTLAKKRKSRAVRHSFVATRERRAAIATDFRARLLCELGGANGSASRDALIATAVSAYTEVAEGTARFLDNRASPRFRQALGVARGQLQRALTALGVIKATRDDPPPPTVKEIIGRIEAAP